MRAEGWDDACVSGMQFGGGSLFSLWHLQSQRPFCSVTISLTFAAFGGFQQFRGDLGLPSPP